MSANSVSGKLIYIFLALVVTAIGCSSDSGEFLTLQGSVKFDEKPVPKGSITFTPHFTGKTHYGKIQSDGTYVIAGGKAMVAPGEYTVSIVATNGPTIDWSEVKNFEDEARVLAEHSKDRFKTRWIVPQKFASASTSPITVTLKPSGGEVNLDLP